MVENGCKGDHTLMKLSKQFSLNELLRAPHKERVRRVIDGFDGFKRQKLDDFVRHVVSKSGIYSPEAKR